MKCSAHRSVFACLLVTLSVSLIGCAGNFNLPDTITTTPLGQGTGDIQGYVHGGRQPIAGASIYLYGAPNTAYSRANSSPPAPISLLGNVKSSLSPDGTCDSSVVAPLYYDGANCYYLTGGTSGNSVDPIGGFNLSGLYHCNVSSANGAVGTLPGQQVWIYSIGGIPGVVGSGNGAPNVQAGLTAALGTCNATTNNFSTYTYVYVNEVSTTAFAYALAGFASDAQHVSAPKTNYTFNASSKFSGGLTNAFNNAAQLYDIFGGTDPGDHSARHTTPNANGTNLPSEGNGKVPYLLINTFADVLAACINSPNATPESSIQCSTLFGDVYGNDNEGSHPVDTASLAIFFAQNPAPPGLNASVSNILSIEDGTGPWQPTYTASTYPLDATAAIIYGSVTSPLGVAIDANGDAYISGGATVTELSPTGNVTASADVTTANSYITIDSTGNIWTPSTSVDSVYKLNSALGALTSYTLTNSGGSKSLTSGSHQMTADNAGTIYVADAGSNLYWTVTNKGKVGNNNLNSAGAGSDTCTTGITGIAYDATSTGYIWSAGNGTSDDVCQITTGASGVPGVVELVGAVPSYIAIDGLGDGWVTSSKGNSLYEVTPHPDVNGPFTGGGLSTPSFLTIDGGSNVWIINNAGSQSGSSGTLAPSLSEFDSAGEALSPVGAKSVSGFQYNQVSEPSGIAVDQSGDVWVTNNAGSTNGNTVFELIGAGFPTVAPLVSGPGKLP